MKESLMEVRVPRVSWALLTLISTLVALSSLWVALTPAGDQTELTGRAWDQFALQDPEVASLYSMDLAILGMLGAGFGVMAVVVSAIPYRHGQRWAWYALTLLPITIGAVAVRMLVDQYSTGYYYAGLTALAAVGLMLAVRTFIQPRGSGP
jgi:hypothetical protein